jgi:hypothetical protein
MSSVLSQLVVCLPVVWVTRIKSHAYISPLPMSIMALEATMYFI